MKKTWGICMLLWASMVQAQDMTNIGQQKPVQLTGSIDARAITYNAKGIAARRQPFSWILSGNVNMQLYGIHIPFNFTVSEQDRNFSQPFNQFGLSPTYKWITVHGGYRNICFSPYTLDGYTMLGAGIELKPKGFQLSVMHGRLNRATTVDTTLGTLQPFSFSRVGTAVKMGFGNDKNFVHVSALKASDDSSSVNIDQTVKQQVRAAANVTGSIAIRQQFGKHVFVEGDAAASIYTNDIGSSLSFSDSAGWAKNVEGIIKINGTSEYSTAFRAALGVETQKVTVKVEYKNISPNYRSMGVYFFNTDIESWTINPSFNFGNFQLNGSVGQQKDNTKKQKESTTERFISMANLSWNMSQKFGVDASFSNFSTNARPTVVLVQNKYVFAQNNNNISVTPRFITSNTKCSHIVLFSYNKAMLTDRNDVTQQVNDIATSIYLLTYTYSAFKPAISITTAINKSTNKLSVGDFDNTGGTVAINKSWLKNKLNSAISATYTSSQSMGSTTTIINGMAHLNYQPTKHHRLNIRYYLLNNNPSSSTAIQYAENTAEFGYTYSF